MGGIGLTVESPAHQNSSTFERSIGFSAPPKIAAELDQFICFKIFNRRGSFVGYWAVDGDAIGPASSLEGLHRMVSLSRQLHVARAEYHKCARLAHASRTVSENAKKVRQLQEVVAFIVNEIEALMLRLPEEEVKAAAN